MTRNKDEILPIDDSPEAVAKAILRAPSKQKSECRYPKRIKER